MDPEQLFYGRALARIQFLMVFLSGAAGDGRVDTC
jgi:hypothetical protein